MGGSQKKVRNMDEDEDFGEEDEDYSDEDD